MSCHVQQYRWDHADIARFTGSTTIGEGASASQSCMQGWDDPGNMNLSSLSPGRDREAVAVEEKNYHRAIRIHGITP